jgi:uncharacterized protein with HEPN domain
MVASGDLILQFAKGGKRNFLQDIKTRSAIERHFEIFGEAATRLSTSFREAHPQVPWRTIVAFRNALIHGYDAVDPEKVWGVISTALKPTLEILRSLVT